MPMVLENASVLFDANDLSAFVKQVTVNRGVEELDQTVMGGSTRYFYPGLKTWSAEIQVVQNFASDSFDDIVSALFEARTSFTVSIKPTATAGDADNPEWSGLCFINAYDPVNGAVGALAEATIGLSAMGALTRATATA